MTTLSLVCGVVLAHQQQAKPSAPPFASPAERQATVDAIKKLAFLVGKFDVTIHIFDGTGPESQTLQTKYMSFTSGAGVSLVTHALMPGAKGMEGMETDVVTYDPEKKTYQAQLFTSATASPIAATGKATEGRFELEYVLPLPNNPAAKGKTIFSITDTGYKVLQQTEVGGAWIKLATIDAKIAR